MTVRSLEASMKTSVSPASAEALLDELGGTLRLGVVGEVDLGGQGTLEQLRRKESGDCDRCDPQSDYQPRPMGARSGQALSK
jgi:hypothetical protein